MICPVCKSDMIVVEHDNIGLDHCPTCQGVWFDSGELELLLESSGLENSLPFLDTILNAMEVSSSERERKCPICRRKMKKGVIDESGEVLVDICRSQHGIWFDGGEINHLLGLPGKKSPGKAGPQQDVMSFLGEAFKSQQ
ncbi:zf-TFIIB domain-containing protein [Chloroflexota bacterium]